MLGRRSVIQKPATQSMGLLTDGRGPTRALRRFHIRPSLLLRLATLGLTLLSLRMVASSGQFMDRLVGASDAASVRPHSLPVAAQLVDDSQATERAMHFTEDRLRSDPEDAGAYARLAGYHLQRLRETGNVQYLERALGAAHSSLDSVPEVRNIGGLTALAQAEYAGHQFSAARDDAARLVELDPNKALPYGILADASVELGQYEQAAEAFRQMGARTRSVATETRLARFASLHGDIDVAQQRLFTGIALALNASVPSRETVAWCRWQYGETAFAKGDYQLAEQQYRDALTTFPGYVYALASLGRVRAARGDLGGAIQEYEDAVTRLPDPSFVAALGDLYALTGHDDDAAQQYALVETIGHLSALNGILYNRQLALFHADHDLQAQEAYADALHEYVERRDIYGADALAWTALKAGKIAEAQSQIQDAMRLGTQDARLFYHAGMIARAAGDEATSRTYLQRALTLNPQFDPLQALRARHALEDAARG